nr:amino acid permease [Acetobacter oeni]
MSGVKQPATLSSSPASKCQSGLKQRHITMISLGGTMGAGLFIGSAGAIATAGPIVILSYIFGGILVLLVNLMLRDMAMQMPGTGSFIFQIRHSLGPLAGFVAGWIYWVVWVTTLGIEVIGSASLLHPYIPLPYAVTELLVLAVMTGVNLMSVRSYGEFECWFAMIKVVAIVLFIIIGALLLTGRTIPVAANLTGYNGLMPHGFMAFLAAVPTVVFSMTGTEIATIAALESDDPDGNIIRIMRTVAIRLLVFYVASVGLVLCLVPWITVVPGQSPFLLVLQNYGIPGAATIMGAVILIAMLSTLNSGIYSASRVLSGMALGGDAPALLGYKKTETHPPHRAILACAAATLVVSVSAVLTPGIVFSFLIAMTGAFIICYNILIVCARLKMACPDAWKGWLALILLSGVLLSMLLQPSTRHELLTGFAALAFITLSGWFKTGWKRPSRPLKWQR